MRRDRPSLRAYRVAFGLPPLPTPDEDLPLLLSVQRSFRGQFRGFRARTASSKLETGLCVRRSFTPRRTGGLRI